jgi:hypothetical protein
VIDYLGDDYLAAGLAPHAPSSVAGHYRPW